LATIGIASAPIASAYPTTGPFGSKLQMTDTVGQVVLVWMVKGLKPSSDTIPGYPVAGNLWEAMAGVKAVQGSVTPAIPQFNARAADGTNYRVLWQAYTPQGISGATIPQGARTHGKIYFDVTGPPPTTVALNNGMEDLLVWGP
jgi:hypothetical protein